MESEDQAIDRILWQGRQWRVVDGFLLADTESGVYDVPWARLGPAMPGIHSTIHADLIGKRWVDFDDFCAAYRHAVVFAGTESHDIDAMEAGARQIKSGERI
ncbi:hypothetical protein C3941_19695 [Kaistia algarum]|uniref:hypothetical protein n=1 Tax=Kaistia algarum TaxID=2083279 RepID=UPI000CE8B30B|nr:hypothetical protein [Kaistia algarum]MCX5516216.1 hypothetical protein [Kaistia algarum]PPE78289.1 hypothetical protein C3941_19695 [Kaistia algarum]